jgi:hypothetical protein
MGAVEGVLLLIDEADRPASEANLGQLCKLLSERLAKRGCEKVCIGLSGLPALLGKLKASHESSLRIFTVLTLEPLEPGESLHVIEKGLEEASKNSGVNIDIDDSAKSMIANLSEGYPHFLQEFAHSAFATDTDNNITVSDVMEGTFGEHGALQQLGKKYFADLYIDQIGSEDYRRVLIAMADRMDAWTGRQEIIEKIWGKGEDRGQCTSRSQGPKNHSFQPKGARRISITYEIVCDMDQGPRGGQIWRSTGNNQQLTIFVPMLF